MPIAGVNITRAVALVEDCCCFRYAANAIEAPLASRHRAVRSFKRLIEKEQPHTATMDF
jgi:hypothetical protein